MGKEGLWGLEQTKGWARDRGMEQFMGLRRGYDIGPRPGIKEMEQFTGLRTGYGMGPGTRGNGDMHRGRALAHLGAP